MRAVRNFGPGLGLGVGFAGLSVAGIAAEKLQLAFHESGHAIAGAHLGTHGLIQQQEHLCTIATPWPLLRYATIKPRQHKGMTYLGETKLTVRWRDMHKHVRWGQRGDDGGVPPLLPCSHARVEEAGEPLTMPLKLARMSYLLAGRIAQDRAFQWRRADTEISTAQAAENVHAIVRSPGSAAGDLRKARQVAASALEEIGKGGSHEPPSPPWADATERLLGSAFIHADNVLRLRWADVCLLAGALTVRGTCDGTQLAILQRHRRLALLRSSASVSSFGPDECVMCEQCLASLARFPFLFGCVVSALRWPDRDPRLGRPGSPFPVTS